jgi:hypothetical protein
MYNYNYCSGILIILTISMLWTLPGAEINLIHFFENTASHKEFQMLGHKKIPLHCEKEPALSLSTARYSNCTVPPVLHYYWFWHSEDSASWYVLIMKANEMHCFSNLFVQMNSNCSSILTMLADANRTSMTNTYCVYTVLRYCWWWTVDMSETCRVLLQINMGNSASRWLSL